MPYIGNFEDANRALAAYTPPAGSMRMRYTLERMQKLMALLGNPQDSLTIVHVAGTSGKTSTSYYIASLLQAAGKKVGLTVSPYIEQVNERLQINLTPLPEAEFCAALSEFLQLIEASRLKPSYFEVLIALAYWYFARVKVDYAVIEVGLGGLLDGTNVISREDKVCVITDIGYDHTEILGDTLELIAAQKAGIITQRNDVIMNEQSSEIINTIQAVANKQNAHLIYADTPSADVVSSLPAFQQRNWGLAYGAYNLIQERDSLPILESEVLASTAETHIPARMEQFKIGNKVVILDGAHNPQKLHAFLSAAKVQAGNKPMAALVAFLQSPEVKISQNTTEATKFCNRLIITEFTANQDMPKKSQSANDILALCQANNYSNATAVTKATVAFKLLLDGPEEILLVTGSLYLVSQLRPVILQLVHDNQ